MKRTDGFQTSNSYKLPSKKYSAIQNYVRRINEIKYDTQADPTSKRTHHYSQSNFPLSSSDLHPTDQNQNVFHRSKAQNLPKRRCLSMKSQFPPEFPTPSNKTKISTVYNQKFNLTNIKIRENLFEEPAKIINKNQTQMKNINQAYRYDENLSKQRVLTEPNETLFGSFQSKTRLNTTFSEIKIKRYDSFEKIETAKKQILSKIHLYVRNLDQKGENQLNQMLTNEYRKRIRFHNDADRYETKIKEMIDTNKQIVKLLKRQLLTQKHPPVDNERINLSQPYILFTKQNQSPDKNVIIDQLQQGQEDTALEINHLKQQNNDSPDSKQGHSKLQGKNFDQEAVNDQEYENEVNHVTKQFLSEWTKSQAHKKVMYQKFRSTIFQKYPEIRRRQRAVKDGTKANINISSSSEDQNSQINIQIDCKMDSKIEAKKGSNMIPNHLESKKTSVHFKNDGSPLKSGAQQSLWNTTVGQGKQPFQKTLRLSKKNSLSKGSTRTLDLLSSEDKQEVARINFSNLIEFIFKRAYFYSVSKKKVIQNKAPYGQMQYTPRVQKKDPNISFILYNKSINEKRHLKTEKLNEKKLRATGNYLIKNKFKIMSLEKEGNKSFDFLRKCLDDAVQDYLRGSKSK